MKKILKNLQKIEPVWLRYVIYAGLGYGVLAILAGIASEPAVFNALMFGAIGYFIGKKQKPKRKRARKKIIKVDEETGEVLV